MSQVLINQSLAELDRLKKVSGSRHESAVREAFKDLPKAWGKQRDLQFVPEYELIDIDIALREDMKAGPR